MISIDNLLSVLGHEIGRMPGWLVSLALLTAAVALGWWFHRLLFGTLTRLMDGESLFRRSVLSRSKGPMRLATIMVSMTAAASVAPLTNGQSDFIRHTMLVGIILLVGWSARTTLYIWTTLHLRRFKLDSEDNLLARKHATQARILQRVAETLIMIVSVSVALMTFDEDRQYGVSLLASAGAAGLVVGLALQPLLKNIIAGIQLAITQPIRIDDALLVENEWGHVEEITSTYVVIRLWDLRRLVVPLSYFIEKPFQNWTREGAAIIGTVFLYTDFTVPVDRLRAKLEEIVRASKLWDGKVVNLQVTDLKESTMEVRMLVSALNSGKAFDLRCEVREKMIAFLQDRFPEALPRLRTSLSAAGALPQ